MWYGASYTNTTMSMAYAQGNPLLFWAFVPAVAGVCARLWRKGDAAGLVVLAIGFFGQWLPWALVPRPAFIYHFLPSAPFGCLAVAMVLASGWRRGGPWRAVSVAYVAAVVAAFAFFYPIYSCLPITPEAYERRLWLDSWR